MHRGAPEQHRQRAVLACGLLGDGARERLGGAAAFAREARWQGVAAGWCGEFGERSPQLGAAGLGGEPVGDLLVAPDGEDGQAARRQARVRAVGEDELLDAGDVALEHRVVAQQRRGHGGARQRVGERRDPSPLGDGGRADHEVLLDLLGRPDEVLRKDRPPEPPASHGPGLRKPVDHDGVVRVLEDRVLLARINQAVVDLVGDDGQPLAGEPPQVGVVEADPRGVRRGVDHHGLHLR